MRIKNVLVTGGSGYIGSQVVKHLRDNGYEVAVIDNFSTGQLNPLIKKAKIYNSDFADVQVLRKIFQEEKPEAIIHLAASISVPESIENPEMYQENNATKSEILWTEAISNNIPHIIYSSTAAVYAPSDKGKIGESHPTKPLSPYGRSKLDAEISLAEISDQSQTRHVILRYFNAIGADPELKNGFNPSTSHHLIANCLKVAHKDLDILEVFGSDYPTPDGTGIRDYIHVDDLARAHLDALKHLQKGGNSDTFNVGLGHGYSVKEIISATEHVTGQKIRTKLMPRRAGDLSIVIADSSKIRTSLGWKSKYNNIEATIEHAWQWYLKSTQ